MALTKAQILASGDLPIQALEVPEWGGVVYLKTLNLYEGIEFNERNEKGSPENMFPLFLLYVLCDEDGNRLFESSELEALQNKNPIVMMRVGKVALELNKITYTADEDREKKCSPNPSE